MALQPKRSDNPVAVPHLIPGEIAITRGNKLWLRAEGRRIGVDTQAWATRAAPAAGVEGAPLGRVRDAVDWAVEHIPSGMVDGVIAVDAPPAAGYGVPGFYPSALGSQMTLGDDEALVEPFYVASEAITLTRLAFRSPAGAATAVRVAVVNADDLTLVDSMILAPRDGINEVVVNVPLARGHYRVVLWSLAAITVECVLGYRFEQGFDLASDGLEFVTRYLTTGDFSAAVDLTGAEVTPETSAQPGELKAVMLRWTL